MVSAMGDTTDELLDLANQVTPLPPGRELDMLLTAGERISMALLAMAIHNLGYEARSYTGSQAGVLTTSAHGRARIIDVTPGRLRTALDEGAIAIVAGFQGVSQDTKDITTLGRGGSDTTAVALAAALHARRVRDLHRRRRDLHRRPADRAQRPAHQEDHLRGDARTGGVRGEGADACGAWSMRAGSRCRSMYARRTRNKHGTLVTGAMEDIPLEQALITGVAHDRSEAKITIVGVPDEPGVAGADLHRPSPGPRSTST